jgi:hypothetical protein
MTMRAQQCDGSRDVYGLLAGHQYTAALLAGALVLRRGLRAGHQKRWLGRVTEQPGGQFAGSADHRDRRGRCPVLRTAAWPVECR